MPRRASPDWTLFQDLDNTSPMTEDKAKKNKPNQSREDRLKAALKANMGKRKAQARARAEPDNKEKKE